MNITKSELKQIIQEELEKVLHESLHEGLPAALGAVGTAAKGYAAGEAADSVAGKSIRKLKDMFRLGDPETMDKGSRIALEEISKLTKRVERLEAALRRILP